MTDYASPFDFKAEAKRIKELSKPMPDGKKWAEAQMKELNAHSEMLRKMSKFVNAKDKNGKHPSGLR